ncbi:UNVERIFIED_CONTAM: hypothetical protein PYX00_009049 [Menopon gallinae]
MAPLGLNHPFLDGCSNLPADKDEDIKLLRVWLEQQPHLPPLTDGHLYLFLHSNYYDLENTKDTIEAYFTIRTTSPELFSNKSPFAKGVKAVLDVAELVPVKKTTPEGYRVLMYRLVDYDASKLQFNEALKTFFLFNDIRLSEDGLSNGYVVIFDMKGVSLSHLTKINLSSIRKFMSYIQEGHPARLKGVHVINAVAFMDKILALIKPLMKSGLIKLLTIHGSDLTNLFKEVPQEILPKDYGGEAEPMSVLHAEHRKMMESKYEKWIEEEECFKMDESKRPKSSKKQCILTNSFKSLAID